MVEAARAREVCCSSSENRLRGPSPTAADLTGLRQGLDRGGSRGVEVLAYARHQPGRRSPCPASLARRALSDHLAPNHNGSGRPEDGGGGRARRGSSRFSDSSARGGDGGGINGTG